MRLIFVLSFLFAGIAQAQSLNFKSDRNQFKMTFIHGLPGCEKMVDTEAYFKRCTGSIISTAPDVDLGVSENRTKVGAFMLTYNSLTELGKSRFAEALYAQLKTRPLQVSGGFNYEFDDVATALKGFRPPTATEEQQHAESMKIMMQKMGGIH